MSRRNPALPLPSAAVSPVASPGYAPLCAPTNLADPFIKGICVAVGAWAAGEGRRLRFQGQTDFLPFPL